MCTVLSYLSTMYHSSQLILHKHSMTVRAIQVTSTKSSSRGRGIARTLVLLLLSLPLSLPIVIAILCFRAFVSCTEGLTPSLLSGARHRSCRCSLISEFKQLSYRSFDHHGPTNTAGVFGAVMYFQDCSGSSYMGCHDGPAHYPHTSCAQGRRTRGRSYKSF